MAVARVADCFRRHAGAYLETFDGWMPLIQRKVISAIIRCQTGELGGCRFECDDCGREHCAGRSCGNRHCPNCQSDKTDAWLEKQSQRLLPVHHFLVTFTVPQELRPVLRAHPKLGYNAIFDAGREALRELAAEERRLGVACLGLFGVLHTWGRDPLTYHPHVHFVVPGGGVTADRGEWRSTPENFLFPKRDIARLYREKFAEKMIASSLHAKIPAEAWRKTWVIDCSPVRDGQAALKYLAPYVYRVAISNQRIESCTDESVTYHVTPTGKKRSRTRTVDGVKFVQGFAQHILPSGFQKTRHYGWMSQNSRVKIDLVRTLVQLFLGALYPIAADEDDADLEESNESPFDGPHRCPECGGEMLLVEIIDGDFSAFVQHCQPFLDSG